MGLSPKMLEMQKECEDTFPSYAWPGGYTIIYVCGDGEVFCGDCVNGENGSEVLNSPFGEDESWDVEDCRTYDEGPSLNCVHCNKELESSYGDPDAS